MCSIQKLPKSAFLFLGGKEFAEVAVQDEGGDPDKAQVDEIGPVEFDDEFALEDEEAWVGKIVVFVVHIKNATTICYRIRTKTPIIIYQ